MKRLEEKTLKELENKAKCLRRHKIRMVTEAQSGHPSTGLSCADIVCALYFYIMNVRPEDPDWEDRDRFILSKGHSCGILYAALAEKGFFPVEELLTYRKINSRLQGHPCKARTPGVEMSSGSLGEGLSVGVGIALGARLDKKNYRIYVLMSDGEQNEGHVWEAAMSAAHYRLSNITAFIDRNRQQVDGYCEDIMNSEPLAEKWRAFGWRVVEIDGHNIREIIEATETANRIKERPTVIIAHTLLGKGISYMENEAEYYAKSTSEQVAQALEELR